MEGRRETVRSSPVGIHVPASSSNSLRLYPPRALTVCRVPNRLPSGYARRGGPVGWGRMAALLTILLGSADGAFAQAPRLFYETDGEGEAVVFLPDWAHDTGSWFQVLPLLRAEGLRLIRYDLRGQGRSEVPVDGDYSLAAHQSDLLRLLDGLGIERAHLVGNGLGAAVALGFALAHPDRAASVSAIDPRLAWDATERSGWEQLLTAWERVGRPTLGEYTSVLVARWLGTDFVARNAWSVPWYDLMLRRQSAPALIASMRAFLESGVDLEASPPVTVPALLAIGERWDAARATERRGLGSAFPIQWRERVEDAGAQPAVDAPRQLAEVLADFLARVTSGT